MLSPDASTVPSILDEMLKAGHQRLSFHTCRQSGLRAIVALHSEDFEVSFGATRLVSYADEQEALRDALRLSRAMSFKAACAGLPIGGGKGVIIGDVRDKAKYLPVYADFIERLGGKFVTGQDMNLTVEDVKTLAERTRYVVGFASAPDDPVTMTAQGVVIGMRAGVEQAFGRPSLGGVRVAIQGLGNVGWQLCRMLRAEGAELSVADVDPLKMQRAHAAFDAEMVSVEGIHRAHADVFAPCARGGTLTERSLSEMPARVIAGAANNQLADEALDGALAHELGKVYCPDFVCNSGGLIAVYHEFYGAEAGESRWRLERIQEVLKRIFELAAAKGLSHAAAAVQVAETEMAGLKAKHAATRAPRPSGRERRLRPDNTLL